MHVTVVPVIPIAEMNVSKHPRKNTGYLELKALRRRGGSG